MMHATPALTRAFAGPTETCKPPAISMGAATTSSNPLPAGQRLGTLGKRPAPVEPRGTVESSGDPRTHKGTVQPSGDSNISSALQLAVRMPCGTRITKTLALDATIQDIVAALTDAGEDGCQFDLVKIYPREVLPLDALQTKLIDLGITNLDSLAFERKRTS